MVFGNAAILIQNMFGVTPEPKNPTNGILGVSATDECLGMSNRMMLPIPFQGLVASKRIGLVDRPFPRFGLDLLHEFPGTHRFDHFDVDAVIPLQEPQDDTFASCRSATFPLAPPPKVRIIQFEFSLEFPTLQLRQMEQGFSQALRDAGDHFDSNVQILSQSVNQLQLIEPLENSNLPTQTITYFCWD